MPSRALSHPQRSEPGPEGDLIVRERPGPKYVHAQVQTRRDEISGGDASMFIKKETPETSSSFLASVSAVPRGHEAGTETSQAPDTTGTLNKRSSSAVDALRERRQRTVDTGSLKRERRKKGSRISKKLKRLLQGPEIPVTCGEAKGILNRNKMEQGVLVKCVQSEEDKSSWLTLREFEIKGKREGSKNWRLTVRCFNWTLGHLIKKKLLPNPPRKRKQLQ
ncbi:PREDICTED: nuclear autoantigen Sp-100-like [Condylura cristata]|uniref:nuclear autoantigen Sp-100-like n=1 Tax=Condylura cristata TaxID=143302 RepID=UPI0006429FED|nr:PREDICTED: nuclear autoantigen Sp-100-like [Condylura cristata]